MTAETPGSASRRDISVELPRPEAAGVDGGGLIVQDDRADHELLGGETRPRTSIRTTCQAKYTATGSTATATAI